MGLNRREALRLLSTAIGGGALSACDTGSSFPATVTPLPLATLVPDKPYPTRGLTVSPAPTAAPVASSAPEASPTLRGRLDNKSTTEIRKVENPGPEDVDEFTNFITPYVLGPGKDELIMKYIRVLKSLSPAKLKEVLEITIETKKADIERGVGLKVPEVTITTRHSALVPLDQKGGNFYVSLEKNTTPDKTGVPYSDRFYFYPTGSVNSGKVVYSPAALLEYAYQITGRKDFKEKDGNLVFEAELPKTQEKITFYPSGVFSISIFRKG